MRLFELLEATSTIDALAKYSGKGYYVHYNDIIKAGIYPMAEYDTPLGVYAYNLDQMLPRIKKFSSASATPFAGNRNYIMVLKPKGNFIDDITKYTNDHLSSDLEKLRPIIIDRLKQEASDSYQFALDQMNDMKENGEDTSFAEMMLDSAKEEMENPWNHFISNLVHEDTPFGTLYELTRKLSEEHPTKWASIFRNLGYTGFSEVTDTGIIHEMQPSQAVFLSKAGFDVVNALPNKDGRTKRFQRTQNKKRGEELPIEAEPFYDPENREI